MIQTTIKPSDFVQAPYVRCPHCGRDTYGVLLIGRRSYTRRCKECLYPSSNQGVQPFHLPEVRKQVIYVDQFAISNMMKALNSACKAHARLKNRQLWLDLFDRLFKLCRMQLIACPDSSFQMDESLLSPFYADLKRMYELLSHGVGFHDPEAIMRYQVTHNVRAWLGNKTPDYHGFDPQGVVGGDLHGWQERFMVSVNLSTAPSLVMALRTERKQIHTQLAAVFKRWRTERGRSFDDWYQEEADAFGPATLQAYANYLVEYAKASLGLVPLSASSVLPPSSVVMVLALRQAFQDEGVPPADVPSKVAEYLNSPSLRDIPFNNIGALLWASVARKAYAGQKRPPNVGMSSDIRMISTLLPYCNALMVDKECHALLKEAPLPTRIGFPARIFSLLNVNEFHAYLSDIESGASATHVGALNEVYGTLWQKPYRPTWT